MGSDCDGRASLVVCSTCSLHRQCRRLLSMVYWLHPTPVLVVTAAMQSFEKLQKTMTEQQQVTTQLMQERQLLQQQIQLLQQQSRDQAEKLRRTQLQKQRLEGLCRTLQVCWHQKCPHAPCSAQVTGCKVQCPVTACVPHGS